MLTTNRISTTLDPWRVMKQVENHWSQQVGDWLASAELATPGGLRLWTNDGQAVVEFDLPGLTAEQLDVTVHRNLLVIDVRPPQDHPESASQGEYRTRETRRVAQRQVQLPFAVDPRKTVAEYQHGVLRVTVEQPEAHRPARIAVKGL